MKKALAIILSFALLTICLNISLAESVTIDFSGYPISFVYALTIHEKANCSAAESPDPSLTK